MKSKSAPVLEPAVSTELRRFLYVSAAITGGAIMIIEILGAKMLAPYVGTSHFVWTAQIAVTLVALAAGYYLGGRFVDQAPKLSRIYLCILAAAAYLAFTVFMVRPIAYACLGFRLALGSLLASTALYFIPLALLAMVGPFFIRVLTVSVSDVGGNIGRLTAISTVGSFVGTVLIGYVLIPFLPNSITMCLTSLLLAGVAGFYFLVWDRRMALKPGVALCILAQLSFLGSAYAREKQSPFESGKELYRANSNFGLLQVVESRYGRYYVNDYLIQNIYDTAERKSKALFTYALHDLAFTYTPQLNKALCIGMGVGIVPSQLAREGVQVDVVEINPAVVPVARRFFDCETDRLNLFLGDGRYFLNQSTNRYDTIIVDAFLGDSSPAHLMTKEAFQSMKLRLNPNGTLVMNTFGDFETGRDFFAASLEKTLKKVFRSVRIHASGNGNVFYVASERQPLEMLGQPDLDHIHPACRHEAAAAFNGIVHADPDHGIVLSDDYNPVEFYDAAIREEHRKMLTEWIRRL